MSIVIARCRLATDCQTPVETIGKKESSLEDVCVNDVCVNYHQPSLLHSD